MRKNSDSPEAEDFGGWSRHLRRTYFSAQKRNTRRPREEPINALKDALYAYYRELKARRLLGELEQYVLETQEPWKGPKPTPVAWVVRLIETKNDWLLDNSARNRMVADLQLADAHDVRPEMLLAFIYEAGPVGVRKEALASGEQFEWVDRYQN